MGIAGFSPGTRVILGDATPEVADEPLIFNVAVRSASVAVIVVLDVPVGAVTS